MDEKVDNRSFWTRHRSWTTRFRENLSGPFVNCLRSLAAGASSVVLRSVAAPREQLHGALLLQDTLGRMLLVVLAARILRYTSLTHPQIRFKLGKVLMCRWVSSHPTSRRAVRATCTHLQPLPLRHQLHHSLSSESSSDHLLPRVPFGFRAPLDHVVLGKDLFRKPPLYVSVKYHLESRLEFMLHEPHCNCVS